MAEAQNKSLLQFLADRKLDEETHELNLAGFPMPIIIRPLTAKEYNEIEEASVSVSKKGQASLRTERLTELILTTAVVEPKFSDVEWLKQIGAHTAGDAISKAFKAGEVARIRQKIMEVSGLLADMDELVDEVKND